MSNTVTNLDEFILPSGIDASNYDHIEIFSKKSKYARSFYISAVPRMATFVEFLNSMGAKIKGAGTGEIRIKGVSSLHGTRHTIIPDRIEAGTYITLAAVAGEEVKIDNIIPHHLEALIAKLREMGVDIDVHADHVIVRGRKEMKAVDFKTSTYPGLATDLQQPLVTLLTQAVGVGMVTDTI